MRRCASSAASSAAAAVSKATQKASPTVLKTSPPRDSKASRKIVSCLTKASAMASGKRSQRWELPSISVKTKVMVPIGAGGMARILWQPEIFAKRKTVRRAALQTFPSPRSRDHS
jgi:hypothetical protein